MLLSSDILDPFDIDQLDGKIIFDEQLGKENDEICGSYRLPARGFTYFVFRKPQAPVATYSLEMQLAAESPEAYLRYQVPRNTQLNADYVRQAIRELLRMRTG